MADHNPFYIPDGAEPLSQTSLRIPTRLKARVQNLARQKGRTFSEILILLIGRAMDLAEQANRAPDDAETPASAPGIQINRHTGLRLRRRRSPAP